MPPESRKLAGRGWKARANSPSPSMASRKWMRTIFIGAVFGVENTPFMDVLRCPGKRIDHRRVCDGQTEMNSRRVLRRLRRSGRSRVNLPADDHGQQN